MADKKKDKEKEKQKKAGDKAPAYNPNAGQQLSPYAQQQQASLLTLLKKNDPSKTWSKDSLLYNLDPTERQAVINSLTPEQRKKFTKTQTEYQRSGGDTAFVKQPNSGQGAGIVGQASDIVTGLGDRLAPFIQGQNERYIRQQQDANLTARDTPEGTISYERDPVTGQIKERTTLSPAQQALYDAEMRGDTAGNKAAAGILEGYKLGDQPAFDRQTYEDQEYAALTRDITKRQQSENAQFTQMMADRGVAPGSEQYNREYDLLKNAHSQEMISARDQARRSGGAEATANIDRWGKSSAIPVDIASGLYNIGSGSKTPAAYAPPNVQLPYTDLVGAGINIAGQQQQLTQQDRQFINSYGLDAWKAQKGFDLSNKPPAGGGGGGGGGGYSFADIMGMIPEQQGGGGTYQPSQTDQAVQQGTDAFVNAATGSIMGGGNSTKMYTQQTPQTQYAGQFGQGGSLFGKKRGLFG